MLKKNKIKVLIIDDNHSILQYLKTVFERYKFDVKTSENGYEGLHEAAEYKPDIIFLDLMMPNIDGIKMLQLKKVLNDIRDIPVIVITANAGRSNVLAAIEAGADRVLSKPINIKQLKAAVDEILEEKSFNISEDSVIEEKEESENTNDEMFQQKFYEFKNDLIGAVGRRDPETIKIIVENLKENCSVENSQIQNHIEELINKEFNRPSDWLFVEMKVKKIEQELKILNGQYQ